jgi:hypothetical protein
MPVECNDLAALAWLGDTEDQVFQGLYECVDGLPNSDPLLERELSRIPMLEVAVLWRLRLLGEMLGLAWTLGAGMLSFQNIVCQLSCEDLFSDERGLDSLRKYTNCIQPCAMVVSARFVSASAIDRSASACLRGESSYNSISGSCAFLSARSCSKSGSSMSVPFVDISFTPKPEVPSTSARERLYTKARLYWSGNFLFVTGICDDVVKCESNRTMLPDSSLVGARVIGWTPGGEERTGHVAELIDGSQICIPSGSELDCSAFDWESWIGRSCKFVRKSSHGKGWSTCVQPSLEASAKLVETWPGAVGLAVSP